MNITHYCSRCGCYHPDVPCASTYKVFACPACQCSPCACPDEQHTRDYEASAIDYYGDDQDDSKGLELVQKALDETVGKLDALQPYLSDSDCYWAHGLGVQL